MPAAFFFGVLLTFRRLKRDSEFVILAATGQSLARLLAPVMGLALLMTLIAAVIVGYLSPHARYGYRALKHEVAEASLTAAVLGGTFIHAGGLTFFAESAQPTVGGLQLAKVFVHQDDGDGGAMVVTGENGLLGQAGDGESPLLVLQQGLRAELPEDGRPQTLTFNDLSWPVVTDAEADFRPRGRDQRELTLPELWTLPATAVEQAQHGGDRRRAARAPGADRDGAAPAAAGGAAGARRRLSATSAAASSIGLVILVVYYEALSFGEALAKRELLAPELGLWLPFLALALGAGWLFLRTLTGSRPARRRG